MHTHAEEVEGTRVPMRRRMDKETMIHPQKAASLGLERQGTRTHAATWTDLAGITQSQISQSQKDK